MRRLRFVDYALAAAILLGVVLRVVDLNVADRTPDEKIYTEQAQALAEGGPDAGRELIARFYRIPALWIYPSPDRMGYTLPLAALMNITGERSAAAGSWLSCAISILTLLAAAWLGLRYFGAWPTVPGVLFLAVFPPELAIARRCWTDAPAELAALGMFCAAAAIWGNSKESWPWIVLPAAGSYAELIKETSVLVYLPCVASAIWALLRRRDMVGARKLALFVIAGGLAAWAALASFTGGFRIPLDIVVEQVRLNVHNQYAIDYASGPGYLLLSAFFVLSPLTTILGAAGIMTAILRRQGPVRLLAWLALFNVAVYMVIPHWLNVRYACASFPLLCLFGGLAIYEGLLWLNRKVGHTSFRAIVVASAIVVLIFAAEDYQRFRKVFVDDATPDLTVRMVLESAK